MEENKVEKVDHPLHYQGSIEPIDYIEAYEFNFNLGNVIKYVSRAGKKKNESTLDDLNKAYWYLGREIKRLEK